MITKNQVYEQIMPIVKKYVLKTNEYFRKEKQDRFMDLTIGENKTYIRVTEKIKSTKEIIQSDRNLIVDLEIKCTIQWKIGKSYSPRIRRELDYSLTPIHEIKELLKNDLNL